MSLLIKQAASQAGCNVNLRDTRGWCDFDLNWKLANCWHPKIHHFLSIQRIRYSTKSSMPDPITHSTHTSPTANVTPNATYHSSLSRFRFSINKKSFLQFRIAIRAQKEGIFTRPFSFCQTPSPNGKRKISQSISRSSANNWQWMRRNWEENTTHTENFSIRNLKNPILKGISKYHILSMLRSNRSRSASVWWWHCGEWYKWQQNKRWKNYK